MESEDSLSISKEKLYQFRLRELKEVLQQLGLSKQGKKQELTDRILNSLQSEEAPRSNGLSRGRVPNKEDIVSIINKTYRKMQNIEINTSEATPINSNSQNGVKKGKKEKKKEKEKEDSSSTSFETKVQCPCGSSLFNESMIKCEDTQCNAWQHINCVIIPENSCEEAPPDIPAMFYCELCRIRRADPFWVPVANPLVPLILPPSIQASDGTNGMQCIEKSFQLSKTNREILQKSEYDLQVWCILVNDKVPFRMQWPLNSDLQVNGIPMRIMSRPNTTQLGNNGRDDGPLITTCSREGMNKISLSKGDSRTFCFGIRIVRRLSLQEVLNLIPKEEEGENYEDALARVKRCIGGGGTANGNADVSDDDSDIELVSDSFTINLRCPMSGSRMKIAGRFKQCAHMGCFDLETFIELNQRSRKWQCPICLKNYSLESIIIDPYFNRIASLTRNYGEDINEIEVKLDGSWRIKTTSSLNLEKWHLPDGTICMAPEFKSCFDPRFGSEIKTEEISPMEIETKPLENTVLNHFDTKSHDLVESKREQQDMNVIVLSDSDDDDDVAVLSTGPVHGGPGVYREGTGNNMSCLDLLSTDVEEFDDLSFWEYQNCPRAREGQQEQLPGGDHLVYPQEVLTDHGTAPQRDDPLAVDSDAASILQSMNGGEKNSPNRVNGPTSKRQSQSQSQNQSPSQREFSTFSPPRQPRSVRPRLVVSIDSDSDSD